MDSSFASVQRGAVDSEDAVVSHQPKLVSCILVSYGKLVDFLEHLLIYTKTGVMRYGGVLIFNVDGPARFRDIWFRLLLLNYSF